MLNLSDLCNAVLFNLQQSELINFGGKPLWGAATNPAITEQSLHFQINQAYQRTFVDLSDCEIELAYFTFTSTANLSDYPLPPGGDIENYYNPSSPVPTVDLSMYANVQRIGRVLYHPHGQVWTQDMAGGIRLVSWRQFMSYCAFGYLRPFSFNVIPDYVAVTPNRKILAFFPGTASDNDHITVEYVPYLTAGTAWPPLTMYDQEPILPDEAMQMIIYWATALCWPKLREMQAMTQYQQLYGAEMLRVREQLGPRSRGDTFRIRDSVMGLAESYPVGGALVLP